ncbi:MAG: WecB/TagA/CpsF family glycosyltransferase [Acidaminococcaceae bacterium]|nr:WecB/TagA/CpsF family glycosyltransferase [Acidaminococcaceae bacterium]
MSDLKTINVLNVPVNPFSMQETLDCLLARLEAGQKTWVITANAEIIMLGQNDSEYMHLLQKATMVLPDGAGTVWAGRTLGYDVPERVAGFDLFLELIKLSAVQHYKIFFLGSAPGVAEIAKKRCEAMAPGVEIVGIHDGYFTEAESKEIVAEINKSGANLLFAALGAPKQEFWLNRFADAINADLCMGIGGSFDVLAGKMERAPKWMQEASLEWFFRLYKQPSRFRRMLVLPCFVAKVLQRKYSSK